MRTLFSGNRPHYLLAVTQLQYQPLHRVSPQIKTQISIIPCLNSRCMWTLWEVMDGADGLGAADVTPAVIHTSVLSISGQPWRSCGRGSGARCGASRRTLHSGSSPLPPPRRLLASGLSRTPWLPFSVCCSSLPASPCLPTLPHPLHLLVHGTVHFSFSVFSGSEHK